MDDLAGLRDRRAELIEQLRAAEAGEVRLMQGDSSGLVNVTPEHIVGLRNEIAELDRYITDVGGSTDA